jgi:cobalamin biosynthesis protein CobT
MCERGYPMDTDLQQILSDLSREKIRAKKASYLTTNKELADTVYPLIGDIVSYFDKRFIETEEIVAEMLEDSDSGLDPELVDKIVGTMDLGRKLCDMVLAAPTTESVGTESRFPDELLTLIEAFRMAASAVEGGLEDESEENDEDDQDDDDDDSESDVEDGEDGKDENNTEGE